MFGVFTRDYRHNTLNSQVTGSEFGKSVTLISVYLPLDQLIFVIHSFENMEKYEECLRSHWFSNLHVFWKHFQS